MENRNQLINEGDSILELINKAKEYWKYFLSKWIFISIFGFSFGGLGLLIAFIKAPTYIATSTIALDTNGSSMSNLLSSASQLASSFGFKAANTAGGEDKLVDIISSKRVVNNSLLTKATINNKEDLLVNHYIDIYELREGFDSDERLKGLIYTTNDISQLSYIQDSILNEIYKQITKNILTVKKADPSYIITVSIKTLSEEFSKYFCKTIIQTVSDYYINNTTQKERETLSAITLTVDSTYRALTEAEDIYAKWKDASSRFIKMQGSIEELRLKRNVEVLSAIYAAEIQNKEMAKFLVLSETPVLQIIDEPNLALEKDRIKKKIALLLGGLIGGCISCGYLIFKKEFFKTEEYKPVSGS